MLRIVICFGAMLTVFSQGDYVFQLDWSGPGFYYYDHIPWFFEILNIKQSLPLAEMLFFVLALGGLACAMVGYRTRVSLSIAIFSIFYIHAARSAYNGNNHHVMYTWTHALFILLFSKKKPTDDWEAIWPVRLIQIMLVSFYFAAGIAKFRGPDFGWVTGGSALQRLLLSKFQPGDFPFDINLMIAFTPQLCWLLSAGIVMLELATPLLLFRFPRVNRILLLSLVLFHIGTRLFTFVPFHYTVFLFVAFWDPLPFFRNTKKYLWLRKSAG